MLKSFMLCAVIMLGTVAPSPAAARHSGFSSKPASCLTVCGDVNSSNMVTSADIITLVNHIFKTSPPISECSDVDNYAGIDAADIVFLINYVFKGGDAPVCPPGNPAYTPAIDSSSWIQIGTVNRDEDTFSVLISAQFGTTISALTIPLTFAGGGVDVDTSVISVGNRGVSYESLGLNSGWTIKTSRIDQPNETILLGFVSFSSFSPASGPLARVHFKPVALADTFVTIIDSTTLPPHNSLCFTTTDALNKRPLFTPGQITWEGSMIGVLRVGYPEDPLYLTDSTPWIAWTYQNSSGAPQVAYELECGTDSDWLVSELWQPGQTTSSDTGIAYAGSALTPGHVNYCRLRIFDGTVWSAWRQVVFRMVGPPDIPEPVQPLSGTCLIDSNYTWLEIQYSNMFPGEPITTEFSWYRVTANVDTVLLATSPWLSLFPNTNWVSWTPPDELIEDSLYFWTARAKNGSFTSLPSVPQWYAYNSSNQAPDPAGMISPGPDAIVYSCSPAFTWQSGTDGDACDRGHFIYTVERAESADLAQGWVDTTILDPLDTTVMFGPGLSLETRYWWAVQVLDEGGASTTSTPQSFRVYSPGDIDASWFLSSADIIRLVNYVFRGNSLSVPTCAAEITGDGIVTASDIIYLLNIVFKGGIQPLGTCCEGPK